MLLHFCSISGAWASYGFGEEGGERIDISERCVRAEELESASRVGHDQPLQDQADRVKLHELRSQASFH